MKSECSNIRSPCLAHALRQPARGSQLLSLNLDFESLIDAIADMILRTFGHRPRTRRTGAGGEGQGGSARYGYCTREHDDLRSEKRWSQSYLRNAAIRRPVWLGISGSNRRIRELSDCVTSEVGLSLGLGCQLLNVGCWGVKRTVPKGLIRRS